MSDLKDLEFLADRARELLNRQISSYRANHNKAATVIGICSIFIPLFLFIIEKLSLFIQIFSIVPLLTFIYSMCLMISVLRSRDLHQGFNYDQFDRLVNEDLEKILLYEIGAKRESIRDNEKITAFQNRRFNKGLITAVVAIFLSILLLLVSLIINSIL